jgi:hypothetical protein
VLAVAVVILSTAGSDRGQTAAPSASPALAVLHEAARAAAAGTAAPVIGPGQAWHTVSVSVVTTQRTHSASSRSAVTSSTTELDKWIGADGMEDEQGQTGSRGAGFAGIGVPASAPGFGDWDPIAPPGGRGLPTAAAAAVPAFLRRLIFDPARGVVLGSRTTLLSRLPLTGTHPGQLLLAWAYQPGLPQPGEVTSLPAAMRQAATHSAKHQSRAPRTR